LRQRKVGAALGIGADVRAISHHPVYLYRESLMIYTRWRDDNFSVQGYLGDPLGDRVVEHLGMDVNVNF
jgi:hypothetical protein